MNKSILSFLFLLFLLPDIGSSAEVSAQLQDSTVVVHGDTTIITYSRPGYDFGIVEPVSGIHRRNRRESEGNAAQPSRKVHIHAVDTTCAVGTIPFQESILPSGGRTYSIPIQTASQYPFCPQVSLVYNSQAREGIAGHGWDVTGISAISITNKSLYYYANIYLDKPIRVSFERSFINA